jgi:outer membrane protein OmpA-like peptidoglycan-associated protein
MKKLLLSVLILAGIYCPAQNNDLPFAIGIMGGITQYNGDLGNGFYAGDQPAYMHAGITSSWSISPRWDLAANLTTGSIGYCESMFSKFRGNQLQLNSNFRFNILKSDNHNLIPYLFAGIGFAYYENHTIRPGLDIITPVGAGVRFGLNERINLFIQETFAYSDHDHRDGETGDNNDSYLHHSIGITFNMGKAKDADNDGVADKNDDCPGTAAGVRVNAKGCPIDKDGDGITDDLDACPEIKGSASAKGCPDKDSDGIADGADKCPDLAGPEELYGCPDTDKDGLIDPEDKCPELAGLIALAGCPDADGDSITDAEDKCPDVPGIAANKGCPEIKEEVKQLFTQALQGIQFETGKAVIRPSSFAILDNVVKVMNENPAYLLTIEGHTDNVGKSDFNLELSQKRADAVREYLVKKGIASGRMTSTGYGDTKPVEDNKQAAGRAKNRRVEFKITF